MQAFDSKKTRTCYGYGLCVAVLTGIVSYKLLNYATLNIWVQLLLSYFAGLAGLVIGCWLGGLRYDEKVRN